MKEPKLEDLDVNQLVALHWLIEETSVTRAAGRLSVSQPAMSRSLASLRQVFGDPLLVQTGRRMTPTPRALVVREPLARAIEALRQAVRAPEAFDPQTTTASFRIAANDYPASACVDVWVRHVAREAPGARLTVVPLTPELPAGLASGAVDLVVLPDLALKNIGAFVDVTQYVQKRIAQDRFVCVMRPGHPAARKRMTPQTFAALDHVLVSPTGSGEGVVDERLERHRLRRRVAYRVPSFLMALPVVAATDCVATLPELLVKHAAGQWLVRPPPVELAPLTLLCAWHPSRTTDAIHKWMREKLIAAIAADVAGR
jgi:DNA-binding transcriptional LysR family regulator